MRILRTLFLVTILISQNASAMDFYLKFNMDQYDNDKSNKFKEVWTLDCNSHGDCTLAQVAIQCRDKSENIDSGIYFDFYSTPPSGQARPLKNLKIDRIKKTIKFNFDQFAGPNNIDCEVKYSSGTVVKKAQCEGHGTWSAGTKYFREWRHNPKTYYLNDICVNIAMPK